MRRVAAAVAEPGQGPERGRVPATVRDRGAVPGDAVFAPLGQRPGVPGLRPCRLCRAEGPGGLPVQPLQAPGRAHRRHGVPLGRGCRWPSGSWRLPPHPEQGRDELGRAGAAARHPQPTAWLIKHKLMAAMAAREAEKPKLAGRVEVDDAYLGGERAGGSAAGVRRARRRSWRRSRSRPSASRVGCG